MKNKKKHKNLYKENKLTHTNSKEKNGNTNF